MSLRHRINRTASILVAISLCLSFSISAGSISADSISAEVPQDSPAKAANKQDPLARAHAQFARGELKEAEASLWTLLASNPDREQALTLLGQIRGRQQRYAEAEALFRRALQIDPNSASAHRGLGSALVAENQPEKAVEQFKAALDLAPADVALKVELARLYGSGGQFDQALAMLQSIPKDRLPVEAIPVKAASLLALDRDADLAGISEQARGSSSAELELADVYLNAKRPDQALKCLDFAAADSKRQPAQFYYLRGRAFQLKSQPEPALSAFKQALTADPKSTDTLVAIAELHAAQNQHADAVIALQKALALNPDSVFVLRHLVVEATKAGKGQVALDAASELAAKSPDNPDDLYLAGAAMLQQNTAGASTVLEKYVALRNDNAKAWLGLGIAYVQQKMRGSRWNVRCNSIRTLRRRSTNSAWWPRMTAAQPKPFNISSGP